MTLYVIIGLLLLIVVYLIAVYNSFVRLNHSVKEAFSTMEVYLKKRWDLIPNLVKVVKGYANHENSVLEKVMVIRNSSYDKMSLNDKLDTNEKLTASISNLFAVVENYPDLKASQNFSDLSEQLSIIEDEIAQSRKYYNAVVKKMNTQIEMFPSNLVASMFGFKHSKMFETQIGERANVEVDF